MIERIDHVNLVVQDLPAMTAFYREVLGLRVTREVSIRGDWIEALTGLEDVEADVVYLEAQTGAALELISYRSPRGPRPNGLGAPNTMGIRHVAFHVQDLDELVERVRASGEGSVTDVHTVPTAQVEFSGRQKRIVYCRDPERNLLELCHYG